MLITRRAEFSASHICAIPGLSPEENYAIYGDESSPNGHGHNYVLEVVLEGTPDPKTGMIIDLKDVKEILEKEVVQPFDHRHLNHEVSAFKETVPTPENIAIYIWNRLVPYFENSQARLALVRLRETDDLYVEYDGSVT